MAIVKNVEVNIKVGKKEYCIKNLILNEYLTRFPNVLIDKYKGVSRALKTCFVKFDTPIENITEESVLKNSDFDIAILEDTIVTEIAPNKITNKYNWSNYIYNFQTAPIPWSNYVGKKICMLGFNHSYIKNDSYNICAVLDLTNYDIYVEEGEEIYITRIDQMSTNAVFSTNDTEKIKGPIHLCANGLPGLLPSRTIEAEGGGARIVYNNAYPKLTHVGLSNNPNRIERSLDLEYEINSNIFTLKNLYSPSGLFPSNDLYPSDEVYLDDKPYEYLILKFTIYQDMDNGTYDTPNVVATDTGYWYLQAIPLDKKQEINLNIKYERG